MSHIYIMGIKERFVLKIIFVIMKFVLCQVFLLIEFSFKYVCCHITINKMC